MNDSKHDDLHEAARRLLRHQEQSLDELTVARLRAARRRALAEEPRRRRTFAFAGGLVAAGMAFALAGVVWLRAPSDLPPPAEEASVADLDLLETESPEFYSDLEFYRWLATQSDATGAS